MRAKIKLTETADIPVELMMTATLGDLREIADALEAGKSGFHGPCYNLLLAVRSVVDNVDKTFWGDEAEGEKS